MIRGVMRRALADLSAGLSVPARRDGVAAPPCIRPRKYLSHIASAPGAFRVWDGSVFEVVLQMFRAMALALVACPFSAR